MFDTDEPVQSVILLVFAQFERIGSVCTGCSAVSSHNDIQVRVRLREGVGKGTLGWWRPNGIALQTLLHNSADGRKHRAISVRESRSGSSPRRTSRAVPTGPNSPQGRRSRLTHCVLGDQRHRALSRATARPPPPQRRSPAART